MAFFPFTPVTYTAPERQSFNFAPYSTPAPAFSAPAREDEMPAWATALMMAGAGILSADPRKGIGGALGEGILGGVRGLRDQKKANDDAYDKKYRQEREKFGDERETWKMAREDHNTGQRFAADSVRDENRYRSEDAGRQLETERFNSRGILDSKIAGDQSARGWAGHALSRERLNFERTKDERDFADRTRRDERDFGLRSNADSRAAAADRRAEEAAALARQQPEVKVNAWGEGVVIPRNEQGVFDIDKIRHIGNPNGGRAASTGAGAGTKVALDPVTAKDRMAIEGYLAREMGMANKFDTDGVPIVDPAFAKNVPASVRATMMDAAAQEYQRTKNIQSAIRVGMERAGIPVGTSLVRGWFSDSVVGPDKKPLDFQAGAMPAPAPATPDRTQIIPRGAAPKPAAPMPQAAPAPQQAKPAAPPMPTSKAQLVPGQAYTLPNGMTAVWDGSGFVAAP
jgi:hypothetical protein